MGKTGAQTETVSGRKNRHVFDKLGKILYQELSTRAVVHSLEGLFQTALAPETTILFTATESIRENHDRLEKQVSDFVLHAGDREFALEFQTAADACIGQRIFGYGYAQGERRKPEVSDAGAVTVYEFPEAAVIYLEPIKDAPDRIQIAIRHKGCRVPVYEARVYKVLDHSLAELEADNLYVLLPFYLLKHRRDVKDRKPDSVRLRELARETAVVVEDITGIVERGVGKAVITERDMVVLLEKTYLLYRELYGMIAEFKEGMMRFEEKFRSKIPAREAELIQRTAQETETKILGLFRQGYSLAEVEKLLAQEAASGGPQPTALS